MTTLAKPTPVRLHIPVIAPRSNSGFQALRKEVQRILSYGLPISFDGEMTGLDPRKHKLVSLAFKPPKKMPLIIDARDVDRQLLADWIRPLFGADILLRGHNLQFDMHWMKSHLGIEPAKSLRYCDTMLNELLILGIGFAEAKERKLHVDLLSTAERYNIAVHKEERVWFIDLDKRPEEWSAPFPDIQVDYIRQDVAVVNQIAELQEQRMIDNSIEFVGALEGRVLPAVVTMRHYGVGIDKTQFEHVLSEVRSETERLAEELHEHLDAYILAARKVEWEKKWQPYQQWAAARDAHIAAVRGTWELVNGVAEPQDKPEPLQLWEEVPQTKSGKPKKATRKPKFKPAISWAEAKKQALAEYEAANGHLNKPAALKNGVNLSSWQQLKVGLSAAISEGLPTGISITLASVNRESLSIYTDRPVIRCYLDYIDNATILKRYGNGWFEENAVWVNDHWRVFPGWGQLNAGTGRFASYGPNFQQVPTNKVGAGLRKAFIPAPGYTFVIADFSNIELRITADLSGDPFMLEAFASGVDLHTRTAEVMFNLNDIPGYRNAVDKKEWADNHDVVFGGEYEEVAPGEWEAVGGQRLKKTSYRKVAKTINFMVLYGGGMRKLAAMLRIEERHAKTLIGLHRETFAVAMAYLEEQGKRISSFSARRDGRVCAITASGRKRWFDIPVLTYRKGMSANEMREAQDDWKGAMSGIRRALANTPIQGTSADITKLAMALWYERYDCEEMHLVAVVHDEFIIEVVQGREQEASEALKDCMFTAMRFFLTRVELGKIEPVVTNWWKH